MLVRTLGVLVLLFAYRSHRCEANPGRLASLAIDSVGDTWMYVQWEKASHPSDSLPVEGCHVSWTLLETRVSASKIVPSFKTLDSVHRCSFNITSLTPGANYHVTVREVSGLGPGTSAEMIRRTSSLRAESPSPTGSSESFVDSGLFIAIVCVGSVLIICLIVLFVVATVACYIWCRTHRQSHSLVDESNLVVERKRSRKGTGNLERKGSFRLSLRRPKAVTDPVDEFRKVSVTLAMESHPPIPASAFLHRLQQMRMNDNQLFMEEFASISSDVLYPTEAAELPHNKEKNRYPNILPYDPTRVKLQSIRWQEGSDYVNANYCDGYQKPKAYIATQGPTPTTLSDFWRMVWEENSRTIVMVTNTHEKATVKCEVYWPSECFRPTVYGQIEVTLQQCTPLADFTIRIFSISKPGSQKDSREVHQFHFTSWPDHGVPQFPTAMLAMNRCVRAHHNKLSGNSPMVVHCSAGVGRTGTFIVIDSSIQRLKHNEELIDIYGHVSLLRTQRNFMVQTEDQYFFIHEAVAEVVAAGITEVTIEDFPDYLERLEQEEYEVTRLEHEFQLLETHRTEPHRFASATKDYNKEKNRFYNLMPYEYNRVKLTMMRGVTGSDYINASFIDSYRQQRAFISTQGPLKNTVRDLWRMIWEQKSPIIVMLTKLEERKQERCCLYWPSERTKSYGDITVEPTLERTLDNYVYREFMVTHSEYPNAHRTLRQFQFLGWPERGVPPSGGPLIELIQEIQKVYNSLETTAPITVMCSTGVGRSGVFISLHIVLERLHIEGLIDVFQTVKMLRIQKPAMVQSLDFYLFCYNAVLDYLQQSGKLKRGRCTSIDRKATIRDLARSENNNAVYGQGQEDPTMQASTFGRSVNGNSNFEDEQYREQNV